VGSYLRRGLTVFVFHEVTEQPSEFQRRASVYTPPAVFERQIRWIGRRFDVISPTQLGRLGGTGPVPANAALITFDDTWAGTFRTAVPLLETLGLPALCFVNTATAGGAPDLAAVRLYEGLHPPEGGPRLERSIESSTAEAVLDEVTERYQANPEFAEFQGATATAEDLRRAARSGLVWFGLHLHHHWDLGLVDAELAGHSLRLNREAVGSYGNALPAFAPPYGRVVAWLDRVCADAGVQQTFLAAGGQNDSADGSPVNRIVLPAGRGVSAELWFVTHRRRLFGRFVGR
jgi:peptidoglycan/xylan/chitin deacetylase (PgdA/CDA1 family)